MTGLSHVQLVVSDVSASAAWYTAALGLEPYAEDLDIGYIALRHRAAKAVFVLTVGSGDGGHRETSRGAGSEVGPESGGVLDHLAFAVPDGTALQAWADHLSQAGIAHPGVVLENGNPTLQLRDPDGTAIELVAPAPVPT
jgi:glyoxylase I family protein